MKSYNKKKESFRMLLLAGAMVVSGCNSDFLDTVPSSSISSSATWTSSNLAMGVVNGVYQQLYHDFDCDGYDVAAFDTYTEVMDVDVNWVGGISPFTVGTATVNSGVFTRYWKNFYEGIYRANDVIANIGHVPDMSDADKGRLIAECKVLRAYNYFRLNALWQGVPIYTEPMMVGNTKKGRSSAEEVWKQVITDCTDAIDEANLPDKYSPTDAHYGRATKGAAYTLRGKAYMWLKDYAHAEADFRHVTGMGYSLFPDYASMFTEENEKNDEYILQYQYEDQEGLGNSLARGYGNRCSVEYSWNNYIPNPCFVDSYETVDGKPFSIDDIIPGYSSMTDKQRIVYYLRDGLTTDEKNTQQEIGADMSKYLSSGNEARILRVYDNRDPRMKANFITPYSTYVGGATGTDHTYTLRWPYRGFDAAAPYDLRTDTNAKFYYLWRKFVLVGHQHKDHDNSPIDYPIFRYADVLISLAEALNEQNKTTEAITYINQVRARAGVALLNSNTYTQVHGQADMRTRIQNEYGWEMAGENVLYYNELRWKTWKEKKFDKADGMTEIWGSKTYHNNWVDEYLYKWAVPQAEIERNRNLHQNDGWY